MTEFDYHHHLAFRKSKALSFAEFLKQCETAPEMVMKTSSQLIAEAVMFFGYELTVRAGEPVIAYKIFDDPFSDGVNAVYGQEFSIKQLVDVIEHIGKESGPNRGIVLVGPPASGKTNIVDLISLAVEEYSKQAHVRLYSFYFHFAGKDGRTLEIRSPLLSNPILLLPALLQRGEAISHPREEFFSHLRDLHEHHLHIPNYYRSATLDKGSMAILQALLDNPRNKGRTLGEIVDEYIRVEEVEFSSGQARGIANTEDLAELKLRAEPKQLGEAFGPILSEHLPGFRLTDYRGALAAANRGLLHIHDAFASGDEHGPSQESYKPLLMLLGSGRAAVESTQASIDTTVIITTNVEELNNLERQLTSSKLMDRVEKIPVNYLLDACAERDILERDLNNMYDRFEVDPNLLRMAACYSVLTRLMPPLGANLPRDWTDEKKDLFCRITPEQKMAVYASQAEDPEGLISRLPFWHPFRAIAVRHGFNLDDAATFADSLVQREDRQTLEQTGLFRPHELNLIDDEFMRELNHEHYPVEGRYGISVRQMQNIMRNTIAASDGRKIHVGTFMSQLARIFDSGPGVHHWLATSEFYRFDEDPVPARLVGPMEFHEGEGGYGDFAGLMRVLRGLYYGIIQAEIVESTVDRDPAEIESDLRRYLQHALLYRAVSNQAFAHVMVPRYSFVDPRSGNQVDRPDEEFMAAIEIILGDGDPLAFRDDVAQRFLRYQETGDLKLAENRSIVTSRGDNITACFSNEYLALLSHRRSVDGLDADSLTKALIQLARGRQTETSDEVSSMVERILGNMAHRFGYSRQIALDTIVFAVRKNIVDFAEILR